MFSWLWRQEEVPRGEAPLFYEVLQPVKVQHGEKGVFRARVRGYPAPKILWYHAEKELPSNEDFLQEFEVATGTAQLTIKEVFIDDRGLYKAIALNELGKDETTGFLTVEDFEILEKSELRRAPRITVPLKAQVLPLSSPVVLRAKFEAFPPPTIKWYKDLREIKPSTEFVIENTDDETVLQIGEIYEDDKGEYQVRVMNEAGEARSAATVVVVHPTQKPDMQPPQFIKTLTPQIVPEGEVAILEAEVTAKPEAEFTWYRHGEELHTDDDLEIQVTSGGNKSTLVIGELFEDDSGDYTVTATNPVGKASSTATLLVEGEIAEEFIPPEFCPPLTPMRVMDGEEVRFTCRAKGHPTPKISWFHNGRPISHHREVKVMQTPDGRVGLLIHEVFPEDAGDYTCIARNKAGEARTTTSLAVESYEYQPDSEAATIASISDKQIFSGTASEDEILDIEKDSESDSEAGSSPFFINRLERVIEVVEKSSVRFIAKTTGYPKPKITWYVDEQPLESSEQFSIENFEDGTVSLNIPYTVVEHCGTYICEAMNRNGIDQTITQLVVIPEEHAEGVSGQYRKPEWVTRMEVLKETMEAERIAPVFIQEIVNGRVQEMENYTFTATFKGNPKPEITWYCNDRLLPQSQVHQMRIRGDKAMLTIVQMSPAMKGEYVCRAHNTVGEATCKATLEVIELTYEDKLKIDDERYAALQIQHAAEFMRLKEVERKEKENVEHKTRMSRMTEERKIRQIEKERELEDARKNVYKKEVKQKVEKIIHEKVKEEIVYSTPKERRIAQVYSGWKKPVELEESYPDLEPEQFAPNQVPGVKCFVRVSETSMKGDEVVNEIAPQFFEDEQVIAEIAKVHHLLKNRVRVNQIWSMFRAGEFKHLQQPKVQTALVKICEYIGHQRNVSMVLAEETQEQAKTHPVGLKALLRMITHAKDIKQEEFFKEVIPREMGKWSQATQELQKVSQMIKQGIENEEIIATCEAGKLPSLKRPETQLPLINIVEKQGHTVMVVQVLVEESSRDAQEERTQAESAWQVVHEEELVEAAVVQVEPEFTPLIEQQTIDIQEVKLPEQHISQPSLQENVEHITLETSQPTIHKPAVQKIPKTDKLKKPSIDQITTQQITKTIEQDTPFTVLQAEKILHTPKQIKQQVVDTEKIDLHTQEIVEERKEEFEETVDMTHISKEMTVTQQANTNLKPIETAPTEIDKPQAVTWRKPKHLSTPEEKAEEIIKLKPVKREAVKTEVEKLEEVTLKPLEGTDTTVIRKEELAKPIEVKHVPKKPKKKKDETIVSEVAKEVHKENKIEIKEEVLLQEIPQIPKEEQPSVSTVESTLQKPSIEAPVVNESKKPKQIDLVTTEIEEIKPQAVTWRKPKRLPGPEEKPEEVVTLKPVTRETIAVEEEKIEVKLKPLPDVGTTVIPKEDIPKLDEVKKEPKKLKKKKEDTIIPEVVKEIHEEGITETKEEDVLLEIANIPKEEHPSVSTVESSLLKPSIEAPVVNESKKPKERDLKTTEIEEIKPQTVTWRKPKRLPGPEEKPEEVVSLKPVVRETRKVEEEKIEVTLKPLPEEITTAIPKKEIPKLDEVKKEPKKIKKKKEDTIVTEVVKEIHEESITETKEEDVQEIPHIPKEEQPSVSTVESTLIKPSIEAPVVNESKKPTKRDLKTTEIEEIKPQSVTWRKPKRLPGPDEKPEEIVTLKPFIRETAKVEEEKIEVTLKPLPEVETKVIEREVEKQTEIKHSPKKPKKKIIITDEVKEFEAVEKPILSPKEEVMTYDAPQIPDEVYPKATTIKEILMEPTIESQELLTHIIKEKEQVIKTEKKRSTKKTVEKLKTKVESEDQTIEEAMYTEEINEFEIPTKENITPTVFELEEASAQEAPTIIQDTVEKSATVESIEQKKTKVKKLKKKLPKEDIQEIVTENVETFEEILPTETPSRTEHTEEHIIIKKVKPEQRVKDTKLVLSSEQTDVLQPMLEESAIAKEGIQEVEVQEITIVQEPIVIEKTEIVKTKKTQVKKVTEVVQEETENLSIPKPIQEAPVMIETTEAVKPFQYEKHTIEIREEPTYHTESITITEVPTEFHEQREIVQTTVHKKPIEETQVIHEDVTQFTQVEGKQILIKDAQQVKPEQIKQLKLVETLVEQESTIEERQEPEHQRKAPIKLDIQPVTVVKEVIAAGVVEPLKIDRPEKKHLQLKEEVGYKTHIAKVLKVHSELNIPGFKALVNLATDSSVDLETIDLLPLEQHKYKEDIVKLSFNLKRGVQVEELITMMKEDEFPSLRPAEDQAAILDVVDRFEHAAVNRVLVKESEDRPQKSIGTKSVIKSIETGKQTMEQVIMDVSKEFGPSSQPVREIAAVGQLLQEGVKCSEVLTLLDAGMLPALQRTETQATLVTMVTGKGHISSVCEVLVAESEAELAEEHHELNTARMTEVQDKLIRATAESVNVKTFTKEMVPGVKAYIKMAQDKTVDIEEMVQKSDVTEEIKREMIQIADMIKHGVIEKDVYSMMEAGEFPEFRKSETQAKLMNVVDDFGHTAIVSDVIIEQAVQQSEHAVGARSIVRMTEQENVSMEHILTKTLPKEITENVESMENLTTISMMLKQGRPSKDVLTMMEAGQLPGLTMPSAQAPLVRIVESEGHLALVCQVLIEESVKNIKADLPKVNVATIASVKPVLETASATQVLVQERELMERVKEQKVEVTGIFEKAQPTTAHGNVELEQSIPVYRSEDLPIEMVSETSHLLSTQTTKANTILDTQQTISVLQVEAFSDVETIHGQAIPKQTNANESEQIPQYSLDITEVDLQESTSAVELPIISETYVKPIIKPQDSISVTSITVQETYEDTDQPKNKYEIASTSQDVQQHVSVQILETNEFPQDLSTVKPNEEQAVQALTISQPIEISEIKTEESFSDAKQIIHPTETHVKPIIKSQDSISVTSVTVQETYEDTDHPKNKYETASTSQDVREHVSIQIPETNEYPLDLDTIKPIKEKAKEELIVSQPVEVSEIKTEESFSDVKQIIHPTETHVKPIIKPQDSISVTSVTVQETYEDTDQPKNKYEIASASQDVQEHVSVQVLETNEYPQDLSTIKPNEEQAVQALIVSQPVEVSEIKTEESFADTKQVIHPTETHVKPIIKPQDSISVTSVTVQETYEDTDQPKNKYETASTSQDVLEHVSVQISETNEFPQDLDTFKPDEEKAIQALIISQPIEVSETKTEESFSDSKQVIHPTKTHGKPIIKPQDSVSVTSVTVQETYEDTDQPKNKYETAKTSQDIQEHVSVQILETNELPTSLDTLKPKEVQAIQALIISEPVQVSETKTEESFSDTKHFTHTTETVKTLFEKHESVSIGETKVQETTSEFEKYPAKEVTAKFSAPSQEPVTISQPTVEEMTEELNLKQTTLEMVQPILIQTEERHEASTSIVTSETKPEVQKISIPKSESLQIIEISSEQATEEIEQIPAEKDRAEITVIKPELIRADQEDVLVLRAPTREKTVIEVVEEFIPSEQEPLKTEQIEEEITIKRKPKPKKPEEIVKTEETEDEVTIKRKARKKQTSEIVEEETAVSLQKTEVTTTVSETAIIEEVQEPYKVEETSSEFQIKRKPKAKKPIPVEVEEEVAFTLKKTEEIQKPLEPEISESVTIVEKPEEPEEVQEPYKVEETSTEFQIKRKPKAKKPILVEEEEEVAFTLQKTEVKEIIQQAVTESIVIEQKPEVEEPYKIEETSTDFQIKRKPKAKKPILVEEEEEVAFTLKKTEEIPVPLEPEITESVTIVEKPQEPEEVQEPYKIEETSTDFQIKRKPKAKKPIVVEEEEEVAFTLKKTEEIKEIKQQEITESLTIEEKPEEIEEPYKIEETSTDFQIKRKPKAKKPIVVEEEEEVAFTLKKTEEIQLPLEPEVTESVTIVEKQEEPEEVQEPYKIEETSTEFQIKRKPKAKKPIIVEEEEEVAFTLKKTEEIKEFLQAEVSESLTVVEKSEEVVEVEEPYKIEESTTDFQIKRKPKTKKPIKVEEEEEVAFTLKKTKEIKEEQPEFNETMTIKEKSEEPEEVQEPYSFEETSSEFLIKRKPKAKKPIKPVVEEEEEVAFTLKKRGEKKETQEFTESVTLKKRSDSPVKEHQEIEEHVAIRLPQPMEYTSEETTEDVKIKMKRPKKQYQIGEEETTESKVILERTESQQDEIVMEENQEITHRILIEESKKPTSEEISQSFKIRRPKKKKYSVEDEEDMEVGFKLKRQEYVTEEGGDVEESFRMRMRTSETEEDTLTESSPSDVEGEFTFEKHTKQKIKRKTQEIESTELFRIPRPPSQAPVVPQEEFSIQEAQLQIVEDTLEIAPPLDVRPGDQLRAIATYIVEDDHENAMHLVEGERVYVQECSNSDWWFVEKHLTKERGFVPAKLLAEEQSYTLYVQKRLEEKIQKLPVFDKPKKGEQATAPKIIVKLEPKVVIDGQETQFTCRVEGHPRPTITWFRQTAIIKPSEEFQTFYSEDNEATLIIKEVFPEDAGMFTCVAKNQAGAAACSAELVVEGPMSDHGSDSVTASRRSLSRESSVCDILEGIPPTFAQKAVTKTTEEGLTIELDVRLVAIPEPEIVWRKNGQAVRESPRIKIIKQKDVHAYRSILVIKDTKKDDEGVFEIVVRNREGEARNTVTLKVMAPEAPEFIERLHDTTVEDDGTIRLVAKVRGNPIPDVSWSRNGQKVKTEKNVIMTYEEELAVLEIRCATRERDIGKYICTATNKMGRVTDFCQVTVGKEAVTFKKGLESCVVEELSEVILECRTSKEVECKWYKDKHKIKESERIQIERNGLSHRLTINSAQVSDAGKYKCIFEKTSTWCNLTVKGSEEFIRKLEDVEVMEKQEAVFEVEVNKESAQVSWHKDGEEITDERFRTSSEDTIRRLILTSATLSDEGEYTCVLGDLECSAELGVRELPAEIKRKMTDLLVYKGNKASFEVELTKGDAVITWFKNDEEIKFSEHYQLSIDGKKQRLMVYNCQMDDAGFYRAVVGKSECSAVLTVELQPEGDFSKKLHSQLDVTSGSEVNFTVFITKAEYDVKWFRNQLEIFETGKYILLKDENQRSFIIKSAAKDDAGDYTCVLGKLKSTCTLNVVVLECAPTIDKSLIQTEYVVKKGCDVTFTIPFKAEPLPTATWIRKGKPIKMTKRHLSTINENCVTFTIHQVENIDCGDYRLELGNHCGNVSIDFTLKILDKPSKPGWPEILQVTNDSVSIHWRAPDDDGGRTITNYLVEYKSKSSNQWMLFNRDYSITETTTIVTHLQQNEEYCFRTSAVNEMGTSDASEESLYVKVCEPIRPEPPTVLEQLQPVVTGLYQKVVLRCVISGTPQPTIEWYKDGQQITSNTTYENFRATYTIWETSGSSSGMYTCRAFNEAGFNECTASVTIQESPKFEWDESLQCQRLYVGDRWHIPIKVTGFPQPKITWTCNDQPIKNFKRIIIHTEEEEGLTDIAIQKLEMEDSGVFSLTVENSAGRATLSFNLRVVEEEKHEEEEIVVEYKEEIHLERPGPPTGPLQFDDITGSSVNLTWKLSTFDGGAAITSYYIEKLEKGQKQWQNVDEVGADITSYTVQNLNEGREYFFRIFASNVMGLSDALEGSETVFIKNPFDVPGPPNGPFEVGNLADSSLLLKWEEPDSDGGSPITGYLLERREAFKKAWQRVGQTAAEVTQMEITGLKRGAAYFFRVFAMNEVGQGPPFQPDEPITAGKKITVPSMPTGLNVMDVTSRTVTLGWAPPHTTGGADLIGYVIQNRLTSESAWKVVRMVDPSVTLFCVENLREKSEYEFRVFAENPVGLSEQAAMTEKVQLKTHATPPSPPTAPLEARPTGPTSLMIEWGAPESDGGAPILGYIIAIRDIKRTMWIEVGQVDANFTRLHIKELQENHEYNVRVFARNEIGTSDPLETEDPVQIIKPDGFQELPEDDAAPSLSYSTTETLSWMREAGVDADIYSYARGRLLNRDEYFFKVWHQQQKHREE